MVKFPGGGAKFSQTRRNSPLSLQKILKKFRKLRDSTNFLFGELSKTTRKSLNTPASNTSIEIMNIYMHKYSVEGRCPLTDYFLSFAKV